MRGRKPKPTVLKLLEGNPGHRPLPKDEPKPEPTIPKCPSHLDKEAKKEWRRMAKELAPLGLLTKLDKAVFAVYCETFSAWMAGAKEIQDKGMILKEKKGKKLTGRLIINPYFRIVNTAKEQMMKALVEMGMTPSSRTRVKTTAAAQKESKKERFFK